MKKVFLCFFFCLVLLTGCHNKRSTNLQDGDIIFHTSTSSQSKAIQAATKSKYSHMGMVYHKDNEIYVLEAVQPVKLTPLQDWINRGKDKHYVVKRLKNSETILTPDVIQKMKEEGDEYLGKDYDLYFEWSDERIYCSELVWKIYKNVLDIELGTLQQVMDFELSHPEVKAIMEERFGDNFSLDEPVISPDQMFKSDLLKTVVKK